LPQIQWNYCNFNHYNWDYSYFYNYILPPVYNKISLNVYVYFLVAGVLLVAIGLQFILQKGFNFPGLVSRMIWCASVGLILILLFQIYFQQQHWAGQMHKFTAKNEESRIWAQWPNESKFFDFVLSHVPSGTSCYVVSQTNPRYIRYALYPRIIVAAWNSYNSNCVFVFNMKYPIQYVPAGFNRVLWYDQQSLIALKGS